MDKIQNNKLKAWMHLSGYVVLILIFMYIVAPFMQRLPMVGTLAKFIDDRNIDAEAYYYTEVEEFGISSIQMHQTMIYMPKDMKE